MFNIINSSELLSNQTVIVAMLAVAFVRVFIEIIGIDTNRWFLARQLGEVRAKQIHRTGLIFSIGFILLFAPGILLGSF